MAAMVAPPAWADRSINRTVPASATGIVEIDNVAGEIVVEGWDRLEVQVTGRLGDRVEGVEVEDRGGRVVVDVELPGKARGDSAAHLTIQVPLGSEIRADGVSANIVVRDVTGRLELETVSGDVAVSGGKAELDAESVSGKVEAEGQFTEVRVETVSGGVWVHGVAPVVRASAVSGALDVRLERLGRVELETVSGNVDVIGDAVDRDAVVDANTHSGNAYVAIPAATSARVSLETHSGHLQNGLGPEPERPRYGPGRHITFTMGDGDARFRIQSFSGNVSLKEQ